MRNLSFFNTLGRLLSTLVLCTCVLATPAYAAEDPMQALLTPMKAKKPFRIGVAVVHLQDDFYKGIIYGIEQEAKYVGAEIVQVSVAGAYGNVREQFAQLEAMKALKVDVIAFSAASFNGYDNMLRSLQEAGIKVVAVGIPVNSKNVDSGVLMNDEQIGSLLAEAICKTGKPSKVITVPGPAGAEWARLRYVAFKEKARNCGMDPLDGAFGGALGLQHGLTQTADLLLRHPDAKYVYTPEISLGMGATQAIRQQRRDAKVVSAAMVREAVPMVKDGRMLAVVSEPTIVMGRLAVQFATRQLAGLPTPELKTSDSAKPPYPHYIVPLTLIGPDNADTHPYELLELPPEHWKLPAFR